MNDRRLTLMVAAVAGVLLLVAARLAMVQLFGGDGEEQFGARDRFITLPAWRGPILDRRGELLAADRSTLDLTIMYPEALLLLRAAGETLPPGERTMLKWSAYVRGRARELRADPQADPAALLLATDALRGTLDAANEESLRRYLDRRLTDLSRVTGESAREIYADLQRIVRSVRQIHAGLPNVPVISEEAGAHTLVGDVSVNVAGLVETQPGRFPGMKARSGTTRYYPDGAPGRQIVGRLWRARPAQQGEADDDPPAAPDELVGMNGVERQYNFLLRGRPGTASMEKDPGSGAMTRRVLFPARGGSRIFLSLNAAAQHAAEEAMEGHKGAVVVMDLRTGELLVAASAPLTEELSRVTQDSVASGSVIKPIVALAAAANGFGPGTTFECRHILAIGTDRFTCSGTHGAVDMRGATSQSCNVYFWELGRKIGPSPILQMARDMGWGDRTGVDLPYEWKGRLPSPERRAGWMLGNTLNLCVGQENLSVTPIQVVVSMGCIATGGKVLRPTVVHRIEPEPESDEPRADTVVRTVTLNQAALAAVRAGMRDAVESPSGTASNLPALRQLRAAVKTGTAETQADTINQAWIAGYFPYDSPRYAFAVVLHRVAGHGATAAGPIAEKVLLVVAQNELE